MVLEILQKDVPNQGIGYLILRDCPEDRLGEALSKGMEKLKKAGAETVFAASLPEGEPLHPGPVGGWKLTHVHDMIRMELPLPAKRPQPDIGLSLRPARKDPEARAYLALMNQAYQQVPNAMTRQESDLHIPNHRCGLAYQGEQLVGAYDLDLSEKIPSLAALAVEPKLWRQGFGRSLLRTVLCSISVKLPACSLETSTANPAALTLFTSEGFVQTGLVSSWFQVT